MAEIKIGDIVVVKGSGKRGKVADLFRSDDAKSGCALLFNVEMDSGEFEFYYADEVELYQLKKEYTVSVDVLENVVVATVYEADENGTREVAKGHGHTIHMGLLGVAQALSYASRRILMDVDTKGVVIKRGEGNGRTN